MEPKAGNYKQVRFMAGISKTDTWVLCAHLQHSVGNHMGWESGSYSGMNPQISVLPWEPIVKMLWAWFSKSSPFCSSGSKYLVPNKTEGTLALPESSGSNSGPIFTGSTNAVRVSSCYIAFLVTPALLTSQGSFGDWLRIALRDPEPRGDAAQQMTAPFLFLTASSGWRWRIIRFLMKYLLIKSQNKSQLPVKQ